ncbi:hypothetical protein GCM10028827_11830 [Mucilaginibacter myungsuensis]
MVTTADRSSDSAASKLCLPLSGGKVLSLGYAVPNMMSPTAAIVKVESGFALGFVLVGAIVKAGLATCLMGW